MNSDIAHHMDANFITMKKPLAIGIQLVKTTMTLSTVSLNENGDGYIYKEIHARFRYNTAANKIKQKSQKIVYK